MNDDKVMQLLIRNGKSLFDLGVTYSIPKYQRPYAWGDDEINQLIDDIMDVEDNRVYHLGSLIVSHNGDNTFEVVDGQQRLTTLFLLLNYLKYNGAIPEEISTSLRFDYRESSNFTLCHIQDILKETIKKEDDRNARPLILGLRVIEDKFKELNPDKFVEKLSHVAIYRIEVPENTDLNRYFEIMNTRGEQLEQHEVMKANLMSLLPTRAEQAFFARIWDACADMTGYVQMHFRNVDERVSLFGPEWSRYPGQNWSQYSTGMRSVSSSRTGHSIDEIIGKDFHVNIISDTNEDDSNARFESIIDFPYFLLHALMTFVAINNVLDDKELLPSLLDDKKLKEMFDIVLYNGSKKGKTFAREFIIHLLRVRFLFDKYIIKREFANDESDGIWSLKELQTSGRSSNKKAYYKNTDFRCPYEREYSGARRQQECLMIQAAMRVSYTSPKTMHWITELLGWLLDNDNNDISKLPGRAEEVAARAVWDNFLSVGDFKLGVKTPHIVFNFLDYLLWKDSPNNKDSFTFEFRNSVEHWYPQHPTEFEPWDEVDTFGNLCIISRSVNSKFSNSSPEQKAIHGKLAQTGSLKLRIMSRFVTENGCTTDSWRDYVCRDHEEEMLSRLKMACNPDEQL